MQMGWFQVLGFLGFFISTRAQIITVSPITQPSYMILAPKELRPGVPATISVTLLTGSSLDVFAEIINGNDSVTTNATVDGGSTELLVFPPIPHGESSFWHRYELRVRGYVGDDVVFTNSTYLDFNMKGLSTFLQTDKPNYLPGQLVKIRAISIRPDGRPYKSQIDIIIKDPRGNMVRQWLSLESVLGVVSKEFLLSENPPLGKWTIVTSVSGVVSEKHFNVAHYVLPKFEVLINSPTTIYHEDSVHGSVTAKYNYKKPVKGYMNITYIYQFHGIAVTYNDSKEIDGTADFTFDVPDYREKRFSEFSDYYDYPDDDEYVDIVVHVTESLTGLTYDSSTKVSLTKSIYMLTFEDYFPIIKPSLNFTAKMKISTLDGRPLSTEDQQKTVAVSITQHINNPWILEWEDDELILRKRNWSDVTPHMPEDPPGRDLEIPVPADGVIPLSIEMSEGAHTLTIDASFEDAHKMLQLYRGYSSPSSSYLQIQRPLLSPQVGVPLLLPIQSNFPMSEVHYMVKSMGQIVSAGTSSVPLSLTPDASWVPMACIIVYCVHPDGEIVNDALQLHTTQVLQNKVSGSWNVGRARPADEVSLSFSVSEPGSLVGLLVVDKAALLGDSHNDITQDMVLEEMAKYGTNEAEMMGDPYSTFTTCDLVVLTDADFHRTKSPGRPVFPGEELHFFGPTMEKYEKSPRVRRNFPETWLWLDIPTGDSTTADVTLIVPDSITTWIATAFVMSESLGLGIMETPAELTVFQDFFVSLNLPAYVVRGEQLVVEVFLFNYLPQDLEVMVIVAESESFEFVFPDDVELAMASVRRVLVGSQQGISIPIPIRPLALGQIPISVKATSSVANDAIYKTVLVKSEGIEESYSTALFLELTPSEASLSRNITFTFPPDVVEGSERAQVTAVGDILGPSIEGLESLIQLPYGCGEQNMINFAPNIYVIQYLTVTGQTSEDIVTKATSYMMKGYERELSYQRENGSFSAFGDRDISGSTWLSAFVLRCFLQARPFIDIDQRVLSRTAAWLGLQGGADGRFEEPGRVIHTELQGGVDSPVSLTAYVLMALLEDDVVKAQYGSQVAAALVYLETRFALGISSNYSLCLVAYTLALADSESAGMALYELMARAEMRDRVPFWSASDLGLSASWQPRSTEIEMAAYVLLSWHRLGRVEEGFPLLRWLSEKRNCKGGFGSTQDTVVALQALSKYGAYGRDGTVDLRIRVNSSPSSTVADFHIDHVNYLLHQSREIDVATLSHLQVTAEGQGIALFQMNVFYNRKSSELSRRRRDTHEKEAFSLDIVFDDEEMYFAHLLICTALVEASMLQTGMAVLEVGLLSGFSLAQGGIPTNDMIMKVETSLGKIVIYLDSVTRGGTCIRIPLIVDYKVAKVQDAVVVIYDYYEPRRKTVRTYRSSWRNNMSICTFCGADCSECRAEYSYISARAPPSNHHHLMASLVSTILIFLVSGV